MKFREYVLKEGMFKNKFRYEYVEGPAEGQWRIIYDYKDNQGRVLMIGNRDKSDGNFVPEKDIKKLVKDLNKGKISVDQVTKMSIMTKFDD